MIINFESLFVFTGDKKLSFYESFNIGPNLISGRNTSGKSTLMQSMLYAFGINDVKEGLYEILSYNPTFRLDFTKNWGRVSERYTLIREADDLYIKGPEGTTIFYGVDFDHSAEHVKLKKYLSEQFGFNLMLEQNGELKHAPLESMFLPYYVSQSVGWVYVRESFSNLNYYKGFSEDYLDYYLGITNDFDRVEHRRLTKAKDTLSSDINNLARYSKKADFKFSCLVDEKFGEDANDYLVDYQIAMQNLIAERNSHTKFSNEISLLQNHKSILRRTKNNIKKQKFDGVDRCPSCTQVLSYSLEGLYSHYQKVNDTEKLEETIKGKLKNKQSALNTADKKIRKLEAEILSTYGELLEIKFEGVTFDEWLENKTDVKLYAHIQAEVKELRVKLDKAKGELSAMKTEDETLVERRAKERNFSTLFNTYLRELKLKPLMEKRYSELYRINSFPFQGVELHKTVMAYHFALNKLIEATDNIHRLPFLLDAVLKEDIDQTNLDLILKFLGKNVPSDTQSFISISEHKVEESVTEREEKPFEAVKVSEVNSSYFSNKAKVIYIGQGEEERSFFTKMSQSDEEMLMDTLDIVS
ncbi:hypothetical protein AB6C52_13055 [Vibrio cyclitrophicus]